MKLEVVTPEENVGDVVGDINRRRGHLDGLSARSNMQVVKAKFRFPKCLDMLHLCEPLLQVVPHLQWSFHITRKPQEILQKKLH
jgi:hypothetical protein